METLLRLSPFHPPAWNSTKSALLLITASLCSSAQPFRQATIATGPSPRWIAVADLNNDRNPDIVVAVLVEHGGWGAEAAAPIASQVINAFVNKQRKKAGNVIQVADASSPQAGPAQTAKPEPKPASVVVSDHKQTPRADGVPTASAARQSQPGAADSSPISRP